MPCVMLSCIVNVVAHTIYIYKLDGIYTVRKNKVAPESFLLFSQRSFGILIQNFTDLFAGK